MPREKIPSESYEQTLFVSWFRKTFPDTIIWSHPNGGHRNKITAVKLKAEGTLKGVPDLFIPAWKLFIEMKRQKGGRVSKEQRELMDYLSDNGYTCMVCNGFDDAKEKILFFCDGI